MVLMNARFSYCSCFQCILSDWAIFRQFLATLLSQLVWRQKLERALWGSRWCWAYGWTMYTLAEATPLTWSAIVVVLNVAFSGIFNFFFDKSAAHHGPQKQGHGPVAEQAISFLLQPLSPKSLQLQAMTSSRRWPSSRTLTDIFFFFMTTLLLGATRIHRIHFPEARRNDRRLLICSKFWQKTDTESFVKARRRALLQLRNEFSRNWSRK